MVLDYTNVLTQPVACGEIPCFARDEGLRERPDV